MLSPDRKQRWFGSSEVVLRDRVELDVIRIVKEEVQLNVHISWSCNHGGVERIAFGGDAPRVRLACGVLRPDAFRTESLVVPER